MANYHLMIKGNPISKQIYAKNKTEALKKAKRLVRKEYHKLIMLKTINYKEF